MELATVSTAGLLWLAVGLVAAGLVSGFLAGLFGIGGGAVVVPVLYETFSAVGIDPSFRMHLTLGTAMVVMAPTTLKSFSGHRARGAVDMEFLKRIAPWVVVGVVLGTFVVKAAPSGALKWVWGVLGTAMALKLAFAREDWRLGDAIPRSRLVEAYAGLVGLISTLMSVGGASFMAMMMTLYGRPLLPSLATSAGIGPLIAIPGAIGYIWAGWGQRGLPPLSLGYVSLIGAALLIPSGVLAAPLGVRMAHGIPRRTLELSFAVFFAVVSIRFLLGSLR